MQPSVCRQRIDKNKCYPEVLKNRHNSVCNDYVPKILLLPVKTRGKFAKLF